jgi:hypothetical protein
MKAGMTDLLRQWALNQLKFFRPGVWGRVSRKSGVELPQFITDVCNRFPFLVPSWSFFITF